MYESEEEYEVYPDDIMKQQWMTYGDEQINLQKDPAITEYNPKLRVEEDKEGIQFALNMLSFKCGFGTKYYEFNGSSVVTFSKAPLSNGNAFTSNAERSSGLTFGFLPLIISLNKIKVSLLNKP